MAPPRRSARARREPALDAARNRRRRELRLPALAVFQLAALRDDTDGGGRAGRRVWRLDRGARPRSSASQNPRRDLPHDVRDFPGHLCIGPPPPPPPSPIAPPLLPPHDSG